MVVVLKNILCPSHCFFFCSRIALSTAKLRNLPSYFFLSFISVRSFVELVPLLLRMDGVKYFLSDKLNQDPVEEHFAKHRARLGGSDNPTVEQYMLTERKLVVAKSELILAFRGGNFRGKKRKQITIDVNDDRTLPKKPKKVKLQTS